MPRRVAPDEVGVFVPGRSGALYHKTSIRSGGEPERLPSTVYDLPLAAPAATGQVTGLR
jgi:hypothetical protein